MRHQVFFVFFAKIKQSTFLFHLDFHFDNILIISLCTPVKRLRFSFVTKSEPLSALETVFPLFFSIVYTNEEIIMSYCNRWILLKFIYDYYGLCWQIDWPVSFSFSFVFFLHFLLLLLCFCTYSFAFFFFRFHLFTFFLSLSLFSSFFPSFCLHTHNLFLTYFLVLLIYHTLLLLPNNINTRDE